MSSRRFLVPFLGIGVVGAGLAAWQFAARPVQSSLQSQPIPVRRAPYNPNLVHQTTQFYAAEAKRDPQSALNKALLANWYLESYRESGDGADILRAERTARASLQLRTRNNGDAFFQLSRALVAQHRFPEALAAARRAAQYNPDALRQCAGVQIEIGDYQAAQRDLQRAPTEGDDPAYLELRARLLEIGGNSVGALALSQRAARQAEANLDMAPQSVAWFHEREGHRFSMLGRLNEAERSYQAALRVFPRDYRTLAALAHLEANRGNWKRAIEWGDQAAAIVPSPETLALLGDAYNALGRNDKARQQYDLVEKIGRLDRAAGVVYDRQRALFYADHNRNLDEAVALARGELRFRHDIYTYDTLAWVLFKKGALTEAAAASQKALGWKTADASLWYHAGMIAAAQGQKPRARDYLQRALSLNPQFHPSAPAQARAALSRLGAIAPKSE